MPKAQDDDLVMSLVELALSQPPDSQETYVRSACADDTELFSQVWDYVRWNRRMQDFLLEPLFPALPQHRFQPGDLLADRFRIVREVAQGGMGIVYEARDEKLGRRIALKCAKSGFNKRLPPEVRHASEISHPNVCKIFEIHTASTSAGDIDFLTMEFLDGETLAARLSHGRLPEIEARAIARQICAGMAEAHRNRVVHGDLKSNNVILAQMPALMESEQRVGRAETARRHQSARSPRQRAKDHRLDQLARRVILAQPQRRDHALARQPDTRHFVFDGEVNQDVGEERMDVEIQVAVDMVEIADQLQMQLDLSAAFVGNFGAQGAVEEIAHPAVHRIFDEAAGVVDQPA